MVCLISMLGALCIHITHVVILCLFCRHHVVVGGHMMQMQVSITYGLFTVTVAIGYHA